MGLESTHPMRTPKNTTRLTIALLAVFLLAGEARQSAVAATTAASDRATPGPDRKQQHQRLATLNEEIAEFADALSELPSVAGLGIVIVHDGRITLAKGAGSRDAGTGQAVGADTLFRVASLSKAFAATIAAQLVRESALRWDMPIQPWLPGFQLASADDTGRVTLRDLLSHRIGLPFNTLDRRLEGDEPYPILVEALQGVPMTCPVGDCFGYQNIAFSLVGDLVFATTGDFYSFQVEKRIFEPLGMHGATYGREALEASGNWARPHVQRSGRLVALTPKDTYYRVAPAAGINASVQDLGLWMIAQMGGRPDVLPQELLDELQTAIVDTPYEIRGTGWRRQRLRSASYGLGWRIMDYAGERLIFHAGAVQGYRAMLGFLPEHGFGVAVLWNSEAAAPSALMPLVLDQYLGLPETDWLERDRLLPTGTRRNARHEAAAPTASDSQP